MWRLSAQLAQNAALMVTTVLRSPNLLVENGRLTTSQDMLHGGIATSWLRAWSKDAWWWRANPALKVGCNTLNMSFRPCCCTVEQQNLCALEIRHSNNMRNQTVVLRRDCCQCLFLRILETPWESPKPSHLAFVGGKRHISAPHNRNWVRYSGCFGFCRHELECPPSEAFLGLL